MPQARILVVDDERDLVWALRHSLVDEGYEVFTAHNGREALAVARQHPPDLIILDIRMPILDGLEVCRTIRRDPTQGAVPILLLSGLGDVDDVVIGLREGADEYVVKPVDLRELKARVMALLRRSRAGRETDLIPDPRQYIVVGNLTLDLQARQVHMGEKTEQLTSTEFKLLHYLMSHPGELFSSQELLEQVWGYPSESTSAGLVRWHIQNLRAKIEPDPARPIHIHNVRGHGYMFERRKTPRTGD